MILTDVNVLVYAHRSDMDEHSSCAAWMAATAAGPEPLALCPPSCAGFVRVVTNPRIFRTPTPLDVAISFIDGLLARRVGMWLEPSARWWSVFADLCRGADARGNLVPDAALAALALEHGCRLATTDRGFARFPGVRWFDPLDTSRPADR